MAENNLLALTLNILFIGLTLLGMLSGYVLLTNSEGRGEIFDNFPDIESFNLNLTSIYSNNVVDTSNTNTNISGLYNPETLSVSGADQSGNAMALNQQELMTLTWNSLSIFMSFVFGIIWTIFLSGVILSILTFLITDYLIKKIRTGT